MNPRRVMIVAGEASGDLHGGNLVRAMAALNPDLRFCGVGGRRMAAAGVELLADAAEMAVVGLTEVLFRLRAILRVLRLLKRRLAAQPPDLLILIDYPDFNLALARAAHRRGIRVLYYISPQVWAWRQGRIATIRENVDRMAVILPFEEAFYRKAGVRVSFVGHPLLDELGETAPREEALARFGLRERTPTVALLPGSRESEVARLLPEMLGACRILQERVPALQFLLPLAQTLSPGFVRQILDAASVPVRVVEDGVHDALAVADAAVVASGTATLETALIGTPMVVVYRVSPLSFAIGRRFIRVDHISLVNLIAGRAVVPELIQHDATAERIAAETLALLTQPDRAREMKTALAAIRGRLGTPGASRRTAAIACAMIENGEGPARPEPGAPPDPASGTGTTGAPDPASRN